MEKFYSIYKAKTQLSELLRFVQSQGVATITDRGKPVARVTAIQNEDLNLEDRLEALQNAGKIIPATQPFKLRTTLRRRGALKRFLDSRD